ncbi:MAG: L-2-hydroxyglutarate oxidase [Rhodothermia bacterium]|nr:L-2-hydroxyglutarate oxidase [Rhodothermia bacterium]
MKYDIVVVGGGIVGLATAYHLLRAHPDQNVAVVEKESAIATHQTGRNSGVIHSGIYYKPGSLKAENCRKGRLALIDFCEEHGVPYEICGKVIVAVEERERPELRRILECGRENGVDCRLISQEELSEREPHCDGLEAIHVPDAGIVDYRGVASRLAQVIEEKGGEIRVATKVEGFKTTPDSVVVTTTAGDLETGIVINCAGLHSDRIARMSGADPDVQIVPFRGEYFELKERASHLCRNLIYPVPDPAYPFLGVHFTRMIDGRVECGPSAVLAFAREGYRFRTFDLGDAMESMRFSGFRRLAASHWRKGAVEFMQSLSKRYYLRALRRLIPEVRSSDLVPAPAGVRAQALRPDGSLVDDFLVLESERFVNVCNAPSPAATASLNIGRMVADKAALHLAA